MVGSRRVPVLAAVAVGGVVLVGLGVFFAREGLQTASAWAGVLSFFLGVIALGVTVWLALRHPPAGRDGQSISGSSAGRDINQIESVDGDFTTGIG
ncbi:MAG: hypothetical protein GEU94_03075 [Micromonosporaceae bacterium]|nr:hypothetical protein [Micromonosporaceae bacterium]